MSPPLDRLILQAEEYLNSLDADVRKRYLEKIEVLGGVDPYSIPEKELSTDPELLPKVAHGDVVNYLVSSISSYTGEMVKAYKSLDSYKFYADGWVKSLRCAEILGNSLVVGLVLHSQRINEKPLKCWFISKPDGTIISAHCLCMAGLGEVCSHVGALLFAVEYSVRTLNEGDNLSVTQKLCYWTPPSLNRSVQYVTLEKLDLSTPLKKLNKLNPLTSETNQTEEHQKQNFENIPEANKEEITALLQYALDAGHQSGLHMLLDPFSANFKTSPSLPPLLSTLFQESLGAKTLEELQALGLTTKIAFSKEQADRLELKTRSQAKSLLWFKHRRGRITASIFKSACRTNPENPSASLLKKICYQSAKVVTPATAYGQKTESKALQLYQKYQFNRHADFEMQKSGLVLNCKMPFLGASPDSFVKCSCCGNGCVEIKCPFNFRETSLEAGVPYLDKDSSGNPIRLNRAHEYYFQVQAQLFVTETRYCDFFVFSNQDFFIERIYPDEGFWNGEYAKAKLFFEKVVMPELLGKVFTRGNAELAQAVGSLLNDMEVE